MGFSISAQFRGRLARGVAIVVMCGAAVGCSRGMDGLTDGLVTNSTNNTRIVRPQVPVGGGYGTIASSPDQQLPPPVYTSAAPVSPVSSSTITSSSLPPPQSAGSWASEPQAPQQVAAASSNIMAAPSQPAAQAGGSYVVAAGDTLYGVARKTGASASAIQQANRLASPDAIRIGQRLVIPGGNNVPTTAVAAAPAPQLSPPTAKPVTAAAQPAQAPKPATVAAYTPPAAEKPVAAAPATAAPVTVRADDTADENTQVASLPAPQSTGVSRLRWPVQGRVVSQFGGSAGGKSSDGIDIAVPEGTSVRADENGVVIYAGDGLKGFGNTVLVRHEDGLVTVYGHASQLKVKRGEQIKRGQEVALSGMTGDADRPKLHFEVRKGTSPVNPVTYLE